MIDQFTIEKVRDAAQILDVVSEYVTLRRRGQNYLGLCPFHADKSPSFSVSPAKNFCKCFSCGEGGDPIHFLMKHEQISYMEAIRQLAKRYGIEIKEHEQTQEEIEAQNDREGMLNLNEFAMKTFENDLYNTDEGRNIGLSYFYERGLQDETIHRYNLGYAIDNKQDFAKRALAKGHKRDYLLDPTETRKIGVGLCYGDDPNKTPTCRFAGRVIFPFHSLSGKAIAFSGRILQRVDHAFKKYVNSPESTIYHKSNFLYGIFQAKGEISRQNKCYIVEGNVDVLSMSQAGFQNVVASAGTALTTNQIRMIKRFSPNVTLMFDGDKAGINASLKTIDLLLLEGMNVHLLLLPDGHDPDSFCRQHTTEELKTFFDSNEQDFIEYKTQMLMREAGNDPAKSSAVVQNIVTSIALIEDKIIASLYVRKTAQTLNVDEMALLKAVEDQRLSDYADNLRKMEIEQRRAEYQAQKAAENAEKTEISDADKRTEDTKSPSQQTEEQQQQPAATATAAQPIAQTQRPFQSTTPTRVVESMAQKLRSDLIACERNIIEYVVRYGGEQFNISWVDENNQSQSETWRVIDYIGYDLTQDQITLQHPLYAKMLQMAIDASADPSATFDSVRFFTGQTDNEITLEVNQMLEDHFEAIGFTKDADLDYNIPRIIIGLKDAILRSRIYNLKLQLREPGADTMSILAELNQYNEAKKTFDKILGERVITGKR